MAGFEYGDEEVGTKEIAVAVASVALAIGVLTLPRSLTEVTNRSDGWMSIVLAGGVGMFIAWMSAKLSSRFPKLTFFQYTTRIAGRYIAGSLSLLLGFSYFLLTAYQTRAIGSITRQYILGRTPLEVISLAFLLVVIYAVAGSRAALLRLNLLFLPIVLFMVLAVLFMNIGFLEYGHLKPFFVTPWSDVLKGAKETVVYFTASTILLFYVSLMNRPGQAGKAALVGGVIPMVTAVLIFMTTVAVFSQNGVMVSVYPTIELAKEVEVPGEFFERFESIFYTIWIMTIFNTAAMSLDIAVWSLGSVFQRIGKTAWLFTLAPFVYIFSMLPKNFTEMAPIADFFLYVNVFLGMVVLPLLYLVARLRGVMGDA